MRYLAYFRLLCLLEIIERLACCWSRGPGGGRILGGLRSLDGGWKGLRGWAWRAGEGSIAAVGEGRYALFVSRRLRSVG